jgi:hypothetical protein
LHFGVTGQVRLNAEMACAPGAEDTHGLDEFLAGTGKRVCDLGRRRVRSLAADDAVCFELTKLSCQDFFADAGRSLRSWAKRLGLKLKCQMARIFHFPLTVLIVACTGQP